MQICRENIFWIIFSPKRMIFRTKRDGQQHLCRTARETACLLRNRFSIDQTILFGSKATGTDTTESDIDLLLITRRDLSWQERNAITEALFDIELAHDVVISTLVVPEAEWTAGRFAILPIHDEIERVGVSA